MKVKLIENDLKVEFNLAAPHIIQSWQWGEFRQKEGKKLIRVGQFKNDNLSSCFQLTFHPVPFLTGTIGYLPKCNLPDKEILDYLIDVGKQNKAAFIKIEPNIELSQNIKAFEAYPKIRRSSKSIFATNTFIIDLTKTEDQLLANMHHKTRYNINLAKKHGVTVLEKNDQKSFETFLKLQRETARRQKFFIHPDSYYRLLWQVLKPAKMIHLLIAYYKRQPLVAWALFRFKDILYYPYGGSSEIYKNLMASNLIAWEATKLGKKLGCKYFDFWGALGPDANKQDPWYGFHRFKAGYGGGLVSYIGTYDLVIDDTKYKILTSLDRLRWILLRTVRR